MRVEGRLEAADGEDEDDRHEGGVQQLQLPLPLAAKKAVHQSSCQRNVNQWCLSVANRWSSLFTFVSDFTAEPMSMVHDLKAAYGQKISLIT